MAHYARLDANNVVTYVTTCDNSFLLVDGKEVRDNKAAMDHLDKSVLPEILNTGVKWIQTSYNANFRERMASPGVIFSESGDLFYPPQRYNSWTLDSNYVWNSPIPVPDDAGFLADGRLKTYDWDEDAYQADNSKGWVERII